MNNQEKKNYNRKMSRRRMGLRSLERVSIAMGALGVEIDPGQLGTAVSMYLEILVHEANQVKEDSLLFSQARKMARSLQWFADTVSEGAASFNLDIGRD